MLFSIRYWWYRTRERIEMRVAWALPRRVALWAMVRVAAHASSGRWGNESPDQIDYKKMHDRWSVTNA